MRRSLLSLAGSLFAVAVSQTCVLAAPLTFAFAGAVTQINTDPSDPFGGSIGFGTPFTGSYTFDSAANDSAADPNTGSYTSLNAPFVLHLLIAGFPFSASAAINIGIANDFAGSIDQYTVFATGPGSLNVSILFQDFTGGVFDNDSLPLTPPDLSQFLSRTLQLTADIAGNQVQIDGTIDEFTAIPEPATLLLVAAPLLLTMARRVRFQLRRKRVATH